MRSRSASWDRQCRRALAASLLVVASSVQGGNAAPLGPPGVHAGRRRERCPSMPSYGRESSRASGAIPSGAAARDRCGSPSRDRGPRWSPPSPSQPEDGGAAQVRAVTSRRATAPSWRRPSSWRWPSRSIPRRLRAARLLPTATPRTLRVAHPPRRDRDAAIAETPRRDHPSRSRAGAEQTHDRTGSPARTAAVHGGRAGLRAGLHPFARRATARLVADCSRAESTTDRSGRGRRRDGRRAHPGTLVGCRHVRWLAACAVTTAASFSAPRGTCPTPASK